MNGVYVKELLTFFSLLRELLKITFNMDFSRWNTFWTACYGAMAFVIILGNTLSITILLKRRLRKRPHFLLISLAMADLLVGLCAMPIYMTTVISNEKLVSKLVSDVVDMFTGFSSVFTLAFISLERLNAIVRPLRHRQLSLRSYLAAIVTPWILSLMVTSTRVLLQFAVMTIQQFLSVIITSLSTPLIISCFAYCVIWRARRTRTIQRFRERQDTRFSKTVFLITGTFFLTWMPFQVLMIVLFKCFLCRDVSVAVVFLIKLLQFSNSVINFFIYCFRLPIYRRALFTIIPCCRDRERNRIVFPFTENQTSSINLISFSSTQSLYHARHS